MRELPIVNKYGVMVSQRILDPKNMFEEEDGLRSERCVKQFVSGRIYVLKTLFTNTSSSELSITAVVDLPSGSIPLETH